MIQIKASNCDISFQIDDEDLAFVLSHTKNWQIKFNRNNTTVAGVFATSKILKQTVYLNRILFKHIPEGLTVDHIDRNPLNNQKLNLRLATPLQQCYNQGPKYNKKYKGVFRSYGESTYYVQIRYEDSNGKKLRYTKYNNFKTQEEAALHANEKFRELHGNFAYQNQIP